MTPHPLDPLTSQEISLSSKIILEKHKPTNPSGWIFNSITLIEPPKADLAPRLLKDENLVGLFPRKSLTLLIERGTGQVYEVVVNLRDGAVERFDQAKPGQQPTLSSEDCLESERIVQECPQVQERCRKLGLKDMSLVTADPWSVGYNGEPEFESKRLVQLFMYKRNFEGDNHYAHPLNFLPVVDLTTGKVISIDDLPIHSDFSPRKTDEDIKIPSPTANYDPDLLPSNFFRKDLKPLHILQPEGPSFLVDGNAISWQKFKFRIGFNYREGLVLHDVRYQDGDGDTLRPLFYRLSLSEMVVPYGSPIPPFHRKCAFDIGDYGLGFCTNSLVLGCDCVGAIRYFDAVLNKHDGSPVAIPNAVCLHEEDASILHKHTEYRTGKVVLARARRLVISFVVTVVNYEYAFYWSFGLDGSINFEVKATGELSTNLLAEGSEAPGFGSIIFPNVLGQYHQHIFCMRIDPMIDGLLNSVAVGDVRALEVGTEGNPYNQGFTVVEKVFSTSKSSITNATPSSSRYWKILNPSSIHPYTGKPVGWKLVPSNSSGGLLAGVGSYIRERAGFATNSLWVTKQRDDEMFAAGFYINQSKGGDDGVTKWMERDEGIENEDVVLWHSFGVTHIPRVEDFPIMPVESTGFTLKPVNFFKANPGLDVPPSSNKTAAENKSRLVLDDDGSEKCH